ncbi:MAG: SDR family oxidoreductase [Bacteroidetes bacterium]|nr:SDR family oxidoreductase [Bacteroidota bacterium]
MLDKEKKILITGGAGFIGSNIVDYLVAQGFKHIRVLDNLETGFLKNIEAHIKNNTIQFIQGSITHYETCLQATQNQDIILHQAALGSVPRSIANPLATHQTNATGFVNMLEAAKENKVQRLVYASSSSVYGDDATMPKKEEVVGTPLSPYAVSKKTNELYADVFATTYQMELIGLRYFNVFGPKQNPQGPYAAVIPIFINKLLQGQAPTIYGDGNNTRDFTYIENVVQANLLAAFTPNKQALNRVYNIACGATTSLNTLYQLITKELQSQVPVAYAPNRKGEIKDSFASIDKAKKELEYLPQINLEEGIKKTVHWYQNNR